MPSTSARAPLVAAALALVLGSCSSGSGSEASGEPASDRSTAVPVTTTSGVDGPPIVVRVVADSEVPGELAELLDGQPGIQVDAHRSVGGATMAQLDESVDEALAAGPDVLVYSGGTNDVEGGRLAMLDGLTHRLATWGERACVVVAVPVFRYDRGSAADVGAQTREERTIEDAAGETGAKVVSYLDVSVAMGERGEDFFAPGEHGEVHPDPSAHRAIAAAIAEQVRACR